MECEQRRVLQPLTIWVFSNLNNLRINMAYLLAPVLLHNISTPLGIVPFAAVAIGGRYYFELLFCVAINLFVRVITHADSCSP